MSEKVVIIGSGCAGATAAVYTARSDLSPVVLEGQEPGGQLTTTTVIENFPGFPEGIDGFDLMQRMKSQAERFGARFRMENVERLEKTAEGFTLTLLGGETIETLTVIIASGARAKWLGLPREKELVGRGVSACATCDGAFFRERPVVVVGGGDSAMEEALFLTRYASEVVISHRRETLRASKIMADRAMNHPKIRFAWNSKVNELLEVDGALSGVIFEDTQTGAKREHKADGLFVAIGHVPNTDFLPPGLLPTDHEGYIKLPGVLTDVAGLFVAGDVSDREYQQAITAAGEGCKAALEAEAYLAEHGLG